MPRVSKRPRPDEVKRSEKERIEVETLEKRIENEAPEAGSLVATGDGQAKLFSDIPISSYTLQGLERGKFRKMTLIQRYAIPHALAGRDILGAAKTGSGKTLAFLIPLVERLFRSRWEAEDGLGGVVISPTRELALQIFEVLRVVADKHYVNCGIVIGGKKYKDEAKRIGMANILVCTPGRLLQHLEQTAMFDTSNVQVLVLDEADRILDMGFQDELNAILSYMPPGRGAGGTRQTLLFSATQTKSVKDLAKLSLHAPEYVSVGMKASAPTPSQLMQTYVVCPLEEKLNVLYSFIRSHLKSKTIMFFSSCKQVRFVDAAFRRLRPGIPLMCLHGKVKQKRRMHIYYDFVNKPASVLFATDIAARGLDFPAVDWVVQADCPENVDSYIHRVGRTARYKRGGKGLTLLLPQEAGGMVPLWSKANIPVKEIKINNSRQQSITKKLQAELAKDPELKMNAQKAYKSYLRSVHLQCNKEVFNVKSLPLGAFASSLGLVATPRLKFVGAGGEESRKQLRQVKNKPKGLAKLKEIIRMEKESKKLARKMAKARAQEESNDSSSDSSSDSEDDSDADANDESVQKKEDDDTMQLLDSLRTTNSKAMKAKKTKWERLISRKATDAVSQVQEHRRKKSQRDKGSDGEDSEDDILQVKHRYEAGEQLPGLDEDAEEAAPSASDLKMYQSERARKRIKINAQGVRKGAVRGDKILFDDDGTVRTPFERVVEQADDLPENLFGESSNHRAKFISEVASRLEEEDTADRLAHRDKVRQRKLERKIKLKALEQGEEAKEAVVTLGGGSDEEGADASSDSSDDEQSEKGNDVPMSVEDVESMALKMIEQS